MHLFRRGRNAIPLTLLAGTLIAVTAGCGGGGGGGGTAPNAATRSAVLRLHTQTFHSLAQNGSAPGGLAGRVNGTAALAASGGGSGGGGASANVSALPMIGGFIQSVVSAPRANGVISGPSGRAASAGRSRSARVRRDGTGNFYFDDWLGLWVDETDLTGKSTYLFYVDQGKTTPAGSVVTTWPVDTALPEEYSSTYSFTAGSQAGSHGSYDSIANADGSGSYTYQDTSVGGWSDSGHGSSSAAGDYTWTNHSAGPGGASSNDSGVFRGDGSGSTHSDSSDGFSSDYVYNADGSGHGKIAGPDPGLPATIVWDADGNTTITYADGSKDTWPGWGIGYGGGGVAVGGSPGTSTTGTATAAPGNTASSDQPPPAPR